MPLSCKCFFNAVGNFSNKNVNVTTIMFLMSGDLTGLCLYILTNLSQSGVELRLGNMGNSRWLLQFTSVGKAYELTWSQPAFKTSTWTLVDPPFVCIFTLFFKLSLLFFMQKKKIKNLFKHWKRWFWPTNGMLSYHLLVKVHNKYLNVLFNWV